MKKIIAITFLILLLSPIALYARERGFFDIAGNGTLEEIQEIFINGVGVNYQIIQPYGIWTPLLVAVRDRNDLAVVRALIDAGADVNVADGLGVTPLIYAQVSPPFFVRAKHDDALELTRILLDAGADINARSHSASTGLFHRNFGTWDMTTEFSSPDMTVLMWAVVLNRLDVVKLLIERGANIRVRDSNGRTAYDLAVKLARGRIADVLMFRNNSVKLTLASVFFILLKALPFIFCLVWLYMHYILRNPIQIPILIYSLWLAPFCIGGRLLFASVPMIKVICLLSIMNLYLLLYWFLAGESEDDISKAKHYSEAKIVEIFLLVCLVLVFAWMINPLLENFSPYRLTFIGIAGWFAGLIITLKGGFARKVSIAFLYICINLLNFNTQAAYGTELDFQNLVRTGTAAHIEQAIKTDDINLEEHPYVLFDALRNPNPGIISVLLEHGADIEHRLNGKAPIHFAALNLARGAPSENEEFIPRLPLSSFFDLLNAGLDINEPSQFGTPLYFALIPSNPDAQFIRFLIAQGADINAQIEYNGETPLMFAVSSLITSPEVIDILLEAGADINATSKNLRAKTSMPQVRYPYYPDMTVLMWAVKHDRLEAVKLLIDRGALIDVKNSEGRTAHDIAVENGFRQIADVLF